MSLELTDSTNSTKGITDLKFLGPQCMLYNSWNITRNKGQIGASN